MDNDRARDDDRRSELNRKTGVSKVGITAETEEREALGGAWRQKAAKGVVWRQAASCGQLRLVATRG